MWKCKSQTSDKYGFEPFETNMKKECSVCGFKHFLQVHHIIPLSEEGDHCEENVVMLCPNHHKMIHNSKLKDKIKISKKGKKRKLTNDDIRYLEIKEDFLRRGGILYGRLIHRNEYPEKEIKKMEEELNNISEEWEFDKYNYIAYLLGTTRDHVISHYVIKNGYTF